MSGDHQCIFILGTLVTPALGFGRGSVGCAGPQFGNPPLVDGVSPASYGFNLEGFL